MQKFDMGPPSAMPLYIYPPESSGLPFWEAPVMIAESATFLCLFFPFLVYPPERT